MGQVIKKATSISVAIGPFVSSTDGATAQTALSLTQPDIRLSKNGATFAQKAAAQTLSAMENGYYSLTLDATDTGTVGILTVHVNKTGALPVFEEFQVVESAIYDALFAAAGTGALPVSSGGIASTAFASNAIAAAAIATGAITSATFAAGAIAAAGIATDAIGATQIAAGGVSKVSADVLSVLKGQDRRGTAQSGGASTMVLAVGDSAVDSFYVGALIVLLEGTGTSVSVAQRTRRITVYTNSTNQVTVDAAWSVAPDSTTVYLIVGG